MTGAFPDKTEHDGLVAGVTWNTPKRVNDIVLVDYVGHDLKDWKDLFENSFKVLNPNEILVVTPMGINRKLRGGSVTFYKSASAVFFWLVQMLEE